MPTNSRLSRLALTFALSILPTLSLAQTSNTPTATPSKDIVLFDFEAGNFDGWTLTGDCWDKAPATPKTFTDKQGRSVVSGIVGNGYLTTLYKNAATTGKAVSKNFTIDKPFLTFKIGGGRYPKEACLNLLVDGKIVRTETGADSATLVPAYWDVSAFMGKTAHLEMVDATPNQQRGYIMLDDLRLSERAPVRPQDMLEQRGIRPQFLQYSRFFENDEQRRRGRYLHFGVREDQFDQMVDAVWVRICGKKYEPYANISVDNIAKYVKEVSSTIEQQGEQEFGAQLTELGHQWLIAEAACAWCLIYIEYDSDMAKAAARGEKFDSTSPQYIRQMLSVTPIKSMCTGQSVLLRDVAMRSGLNCQIVYGRLRDIGGKESGSHQWNIFVFSNEIAVPADATTLGKLQDVVKYGGKIRAYANLPRRREEWELYHALYFNKPTKDLPLDGNILDLSQEQWYAFNFIGNDYLSVFHKLVRR